MRLPSDYLKQQACRGTFNSCMKAAVRSVWRAVRGRDRGNVSVKAVGRRGSESHPRAPGGPASAAKAETGQTDQGQPTERRQTSRPEELQEASRIAALLRDRFGIED